MKAGEVFGVVPIDEKIADRYILEKLKKAREVVGEEFVFGLPTSRHVSRIVSKATASIPEVMEGAIPLLPVDDEVPLEAVLDIARAAELDKVAVEVNKLNVSGKAVQFMEALKRAGYWKLANFQAIYVFSRTAGIATVDDLLDMYSKGIREMVI